MRILLTGGYGFIGSNLVRHLLGPEGMGVSHLVNLDKMTYAANPENLADLVDDPRHVPIQGDIGDEGLVTRLFVEHDFDAVILSAKWLAFVGDNLYEFSLRINRHLNHLRGRLGLPYWSLSAYLKHKVKSALNYVTEFEKAVAREARARGHDGVVCGHIHRAEMREIDGTLYCNDGDWVESRTALVEHMDGRLELLHWNPGALATEASAKPRSAQETANVLEVQA